jgi:hypothetical protein
MSFKASIFIGSRERICGTQADQSSIFKNKNENGSLKFLKIIGLHVG